MNDQINEAGVQLESAFQLFNQFSEELVDSYADLETRVTELSQELANERSERLLQLAEKERLAKRLESLFDALPAGVVVLNAEGCITQTNRIANEMLNFDSRTDVFTDTHWEKIAGDTFLTDGDELRLKDGRWINLSACKLNNALEKIVLISDVSETHAMHEALDRQQRLSALGEMIASLAHQIRTPLASALLNISNASHPANNEIRRVQFTDQAKERLRHLERMVDDMLLFARGDVSDAENMNAAMFCAQLQKSLGHNNRSQNIKFQLDCNLNDLTIRANIDVLLSSIQNIVDNAIEACDTVHGENETGEIQIKAFLNDENEFEINIKDNGCGMNKETIKRVLEPFFTTRSDGTGLGLAIVNATVNRYNGEMSIHSELGKGSNFNIKFPRAVINGILASDLTNTDDNQIFTNETTNYNEQITQAASKTFGAKEVVL
jgi:two-component system sensor histidine kinase FlrB